MQAENNAGTSSLSVGTSGHQRETDPPSREGRLRITFLVPQGLADNGEEVIRGLSAPFKTLPTRYLYDNRGSQLFEEICTLPEYYLTRTETEILQRHARDIATITGPCELVELGSGSSVKTRLLLDAYQELKLPLQYCPIDISAGFLEDSAKNLLSSYPSLVIEGLASTYEAALLQLPPSPLPHRMIMFIGSSLGNIHREESGEFLQKIADALQPGDYFLLGVDLIKEVGQLEAAYNDQRGVTAEFHKNILHHLNGKFGGNFELDRFSYMSFYNPSKQQMETYLRSLTAHTVTLSKLHLAIQMDQGETIWTQISRKFDLEGIRTDLEQKQLRCLETWTDPRIWYSVLLCNKTRTNDY